MNQIAHAQGFLHVLVAVRVGNAAPGGAELAAALGQAVLFQAILRHMVGHADGGPVADLQVLGADLNALRPQVGDLLFQVGGVYDHAVAHHAHHVGAQNAGGQQVQHELAAGVHHGVARVVAALIAADNVILLAEQVHHTALALVAPVDSGNRSQHTRNSSQSECISGQPFPGALPGIRCR